MSDGTQPCRIGVISDTHGMVHPAVFRIFAGVELILHAGDIGSGDVLEELETIAPVRAVPGNTDGWMARVNRPLCLELETAAGRVAMTHGHLAVASAFAPDSLVHYFRDFRPGIIVYGHTHRARSTRLDGVALFNPGVAGAGHARHGRSVGLITVLGTGQPPDFEHRVLK